MYGYMGKLLFVNLSDKSYEVRELPEDWARNFIGGPALGARILFEYMPAGADVFGPKSMLGFLGGPLNNTPALFGGRYTVVSKSPVYNGFNDCNSGGFFGPMLRKAGFDGVFINGISEEPVYILIDDGKVSFHDASHLWGMVISETEEAIGKTMPDDKWNAAIIGPAGENLSYMAAIMNDGHRSAARGGSGAVMGSKKLKALVVRGAAETPVCNKEALLEINKAYLDHIKNGPPAPIIGAVKMFGTNMGYEASVDSGDAGIMNWHGSLEKNYTEEGKKATSVFTYDGKHKVKAYGCASCPLRCGAIYEVEHDKWGLEHTSRPEYETAGAFGCNLLIEDAEAMIYCNHIVNEYGLDSISAGGTIAWITQCYNEGVFTKEELDGIDLKWGDADAMVDMTTKMCKGEGFGKLLQLGSYHAAKKLGRGEEYVVAASGIEPGQHGSLYSPGMCRTYQYDPTPGRHTKGSYGQGRPLPVPGNYKGTGYLDLIASVPTELTNASGICMLNVYGFDPTLCRRLVGAVTGFDSSALAERTFGMRSMHMRQAFNVREGLRRKDFWMSDVMFKAPDDMGGPLAGTHHDNEQMASNYFEAIGWSEDMVPLKEAMADIGGMDEIIAALYPEPAPAAPAEA